MQTTAEIPEDSLEILYSLARKYPLLSADEERQWDDRKWQAVQQLLGLLCGEKDAHRWLVSLLGHLYANPPRVEDFSSREHFFVIQRDMKELGEHDGRFSRKSLFSLFSSDRLPATLVVGCAEYLSQAATSNHASPVAAALVDYSQRCPLELAPPSPAPEFALQLKDGIADYLNARDKLTLHNLRLVFTIAGRYRGKQLPHNDLVQEGIIGLIRAAEKYRFNTGNRFSTYAFNWISQAVRRSSVDQTGIVRYPTHVQEQVNRLYRLRSDLWARGQESGPAELAEAAGMSESKVREILNLRNLPTSLDAPMHDDDGGTTLGDTLSGGPFEPSEESAWRVSLNRQLKMRLEKLEPAEAEVITGRWGLEGGPPLTRAQLADKMRVSREWVRQLESNALAKLQNDPTIVQTYNHYKMEQRDN